ncbi:MarR family winged helix-turn-helix transcriptional regulator [Mesorhizobium sp. NPDC059054]|uniref:MarR family winged helix-turn-helix transcriptional regulator n=1 Tax=unclassified Mesorhizobium TaxID=325217 RepID=UPI0006C75D9A|nr:MarR family winged helix-turn-helix transcriptional regulator [Mesorhizobium sp. 1M-11]
MSEVSSKSSQQTDHTIPQGDYFVQEFVPFILNNVTNTINQRFKKSLRKFDLNVTQWRVLAALGQKGNVSLTDLCAMTAIDQPSLSRVIDLLVERNLVTRAPRATDGRFNEIALSREGQSLRDRAWPMAIEHAELAVNGLTGDEQETLRQLLKKMMASLRGD